MNTPTIETERLILRRFTIDDKESFFTLMSDTEVNAFLPLYPPETIGEAVKVLQKNYIETYKQAIGFRYSIGLKDEDISIGYVNMSYDDSYDFGYALRKDFWGKGIVTEASKAVIEQIRLSGIPYITATHDVNNYKSGNVMKNLGMTYRYSYEELWQPKNIKVIFRMYQLDFTLTNKTYKKYWNIYPTHFIEKCV